MAEEIYKVTSPVPPPGDNEEMSLDQYLQSRSNLIQQQFANQPDASEAYMMSISDTAMSGTDVDFVREKHAKKDKDKGDKQKEDDLEVGDAQKYECAKGATEQEMETELKKPLKTSSSYLALYSETPLSRETGSDDSDESDYEGKMVEATSQEETKGDAEASEPGALQFATAILSGSFAYEDMEKFEKDLDDEDVYGGEVTPTMSMTAYSEYADEMPSASRTTLSSTLSDVLASNETVTFTISDTKTRDFSTHVMVDDSSISMELVPAVGVFMEKKCEGYVSNRTSDVQIRNELDAMSRDMSREEFIEDTIEAVSKSYNVSEEDLKTNAEVALHDKVSSGLATDLQGKKSSNVAKLLEFGARKASNVDHLIDEKKSSEITVEEEISSEVEIADKKSDMKEASSVHKKISAAGDMDKNQPSMTEASRMTESHFSTSIGARQSENMEAFMDSIDDIALDPERPSLTSLDDQESSNFEMAAGECQSGSFDAEMGARKSSHVEMVFGMAGRDSPKTIPYIDQGKGEMNRMEEQLDEPEVKPPLTGNIKKQDSSSMQVPLVKKRSSTVEGFVDEVVDAEDTTDDVSMDTDAVVQNNKSFNVTTSIELAKCSETETNTMQQVSIGELPLDDSLLSAQKSSKAAASLNDKSSSSIRGAADSAEFSNTDSVGIIDSTTSSHEKASADRRKSSSIKTVLQNKSFSTTDNSAGDRFPMPSTATSANKSSKTTAVGDRRKSSSKAVAMPTAVAMTTAVTMPADQQLPEHKVSLTDMTTAAKKASEPGLNGKKMSSRSTTGGCKKRSKADADLQGKKSSNIHSAIEGKQSSNMSAALGGKTMSDLDAPSSNKTSSFIKSFFEDKKASAGSLSTDGKKSSNKFLSFLEKRKSSKTAGEVDRKKSSNMETTLVENKSAQTGDSLHLKKSSGLLEKRLSKHAPVEEKTPSMVEAALHEKKSSKVMHLDKKKSSRIEEILQEEKSALIDIALDDKKSSKIAGISEKKSSKLAAVDTKKSSHTQTTLYEKRSSQTASLHERTSSKIEKLHDRKSSKQEAAVDERKSPGMVNSIKEKKSSKFAAFLKGKKSYNVSSEEAISPAADGTAEDIVKEVLEDVMMLGSRKRSSKLASAVSAELKANEENERKDSSSQIEMETRKASSEFLATHENIAAEIKVHAEVHQRDAPGADNVKKDSSYILALSVSGSGEQSESASFEESQETAEENVDTDNGQDSPSLLNSLSLQKSEQKSESHKLSSKCDKSLDEKEMSKTSVALGEKGLSDDTLVPIEDIMYTAEDPSQTGTVIKAEKSATITPPVEQEVSDDVEQEGDYAGVDTAEYAKHIVEEAIKEQIKADLGRLAIGQLEDEFQESKEDIDFSMGECSKEHQKKRSHTLTLKTKPMPTADQTSVQVRFVQQKNADGEKQTEVNIFEVLQDGKMKLAVPLDTDFFDPTYRTNSKLEEVKKWLVESVANNAGSALGEPADGSGPSKTEDQEVEIAEAVSGSDVKIGESAGQLNRMNIGASQEIKDHDNVKNEHEDGQEQTQEMSQDMPMEGLKKESFSSTKGQYTSDEELNKSKSSLKETTTSSHKSKLSQASGKAADSKIDFDQVSDSPYRPRIAFFGYFTQIHPNPTDSDETLDKLSEELNGSLDEGIDVLNEFSSQADAAGGVDSEAGGKKADKEEIAATVEEEAAAAGAETQDMEEVSQNQAENLGEQDGALPAGHVEKAASDEKSGKAAGLGEKTSSDTRRKRKNVMHRDQATATDDDVVTGAGKSGYRLVELKDKNAQIEEPRHGLKRDKSTQTYTVKVSPSRRVGKQGKSENSQKQSTNPAAAVSDTKPEQKRAGSLQESGKERRSNRQIKMIADEGANKSTSSQPTAARSGQRTDQRKTTAIKKILDQEHKANISQPTVKRDEQGAQRKIKSTNEVKRQAIDKAASAPRHRVDEGQCRGPEMRQRYDNDRKVRKDSREMLKERRRSRKKADAGADAMVQTDSRGTMTTRYGRMPDDRDWSAEDEEEAPRRRSLIARAWHRLEKRAKEHIPCLRRRSQNMMEN